MAEPYRLLFTRSALREMERLPRPVLALLRPRLDELIQQPRPYGSQKLTGTPYYRIRQGDYRVLYSVDDGARTVEIIKIGHRREVYR